MVEAEGAATFQASVDVYDRHVGRYGRPLSLGLIEASGLRSDQTALDVGCGPGVLTSALADFLGAANVSGVDPSEPFVELCRARVPGADIRHARAEELPFDTAFFDASFAQLVVNFMSDARAGVSEMARVTKPGGSVSAAVWDYAGDMTMLRVFWDAAVALDPSAEAKDEGRVMRYCSPDELTDLWNGAGLTNVRTGALHPSASYTDFDDYWIPFTTGLAPSGAYAASLDPDRQGALRDEVHRRLGSPQGPFELTCRAWFVTGSKA